MIGGDAGAGGDGGADGGGDGGCDGGDATATTGAAAVTAAWCKGPCLDGLRRAPVLEGEAATAVVAAAALALAMPGVSATTTAMVFRPWDRRSCAKHTKS